MKGTNWKHGDTDRGLDGKGAGLRTNIDYGWKSSQYAAKALYNNAWLFAGRRQKGGSSHSSTSDAGKEDGKGAAHILKTKGCRGNGICNPPTRKEKEGTFGEQAKETREELRYKGLGRTNEQRGMLPFPKGVIIAGEQGRNFARSCYPGRKYKG